MSKAAQRAAWHAELVGLGMSGGDAAAAVNNPNFDAARNAFEHARGVYTNYNAQQAALRAQERMQQQQMALMAAIAKGPPKPNRALKGQNYSPKFKAAGSKTQAARAVSKGTYQFSNPLGMGGSGSRTGGIGGLA